MTIDAENMSSLAIRLRDSRTFPWRHDPVSEPFADWATQTRGRIHTALTLGPDASPTGDIVAEWRDGDLSGQHLRLGFSNGETSQAYLLRPGDGTKNPSPAILLLHDHGSFFSIGKEKLIRRPNETPDLTADIDHWTARIYGGRHVGNALASRGYTVLSVDALGWGSRRGNGYGDQQALAANLMQFGTSLAGVVLQEDLEALNYLASLDGIDKNRIAVLGYSMGGFRAFQLAALSDRAKACVSGGWMGTLSGLMQSGNNQLRGQSAFYMLHPQIAGKLDYPDLAGLAAPKPALFFAGAEDRHFPEPVVADAFRRLTSLWTEAGARDRLETRLFPGGHSFPRDRQDHAFDWLDRTL
ncbi:MAG: alpha/beta fold hydrolase [Neorhizobium sp.]|nr:alpha/beta fold hydrolase [Neorhizobium sp.]